MASNGRTKKQHPQTAANELITQLTKEQEVTLANCLSTIKHCKSDEVANFHRLADAFHQIKAQKLYVGYTNERAFFKEKLGYSRSHALRLASEGRLLTRLSPMGDNLVKLFASDRHLRPLLKYGPGDQDAAIELLQKWAKMAGLSEWSPKLIESAVTFLHPPAGPMEPRDSIAIELAGKFCQAIDGSKAVLQNHQPKLPRDIVTMVLKELENLSKKALALAGPRRSTGIDWTDATWNPLEGCSHASRGCDHCYAAKLVATRMSDIYPGLAKKVVIEGHETYAFTGKIVLLPDQLGVPLLDRVPKRYFVNSMSDLFHPKVPEEFIIAVFKVMEMAHWHTFQVLTKRPDRMAEFTQKYYRDRQPPGHIWLGTSTEDQETYDKRNRHLRATRSAIRWLSLEPLLGPIKLGSLKGIGWAVAGGESGSDRRMEKPWATDLRDQCNEAGVPFFFKQWGDFNEAGVKVKKKQKKDRLTPPALDGVVHNAYPEPP